LKRISHAYVIATSLKFQLPEGLAGDVNAATFKKIVHHTNTKQRFFQVADHKAHKPKFANADKLTEVSGVVKQTLSKIIAGTPYAKGYLATSFRLFPGTLPHQLKF
jgi:hypothetical protein